jgi:hypothetical protein
MTDELPILPLSVHYIDGTVVHLKDEDQIAFYAAFDPLGFDSRDEEDLRRLNIDRIVDRLGRQVHLVVERCDISVLKLESESE